MSGHMSDCIFCKIAAGTIPTEMLYTDEYCVAFRDIHPQAPTHVLVIPRRHVPDLPGLYSENLDGKEGAGELAARLLKAASQVARDAGLHESGFRVVINTGEHGGQSVPHLHLHVLGKRPMAWPPG
jgi:histidine triad (HIT) family protein